MNAVNHNHEDRGQRVAEAIARVRSAEDAGTARPLDDWLREYPDLSAGRGEGGFVGGVWEGRRRSAAPPRGPPRPAGPPADPRAEAPTLVRPDGDTAAPSGVLPPGSIFGEYELVSEIARGGMGVVYRARHARLGRVVALKMILSGRFASADEVRRFRTEAGAAAQLDHPHIVPIYEVGDVAGQHFFTMKLIDGQNLQQVLGDKGRRLTPAAAVRLMIQVAQAVHHAHQRGIVHRDLKPGNILVDAKHDAHVTDFGLVKNVEQMGQASHDALTRTGAIVGTPSYMSPEQARAERSLTTASDIYSLGAILYEMLTGQPPFRATNPVETLMQVIEREPPRPRSLNGALDQDLETICLKCLEKDPSQRYNSAGSLADDLQRWERKEPIQARPVGSLERAWRWCRRNPVVATLTVAVATLLVGGVIGLAVANAAILRSRDAAEQAAQRERDLRKEEATQRQRADELAEQERSMRTTLESTQQLVTTSLRNTQVALNKERVMAYANRLGSARMALAANNVVLAESFLDDCPSDLRGWEWNYLKRLCHTETLSVMGSVGALHPTEPLLAVAEPQGLRLRRVPGGEVALELSGQPGTVQYLAWTAGGTRLVAAHGLGTRQAAVRVWDINTGQLIDTLTEERGIIYFCSASADGKWVALAVGRATTESLVDVAEIVFRNLEDGSRVLGPREMFDRRPGPEADPFRIRAVQHLVFRADSQEAAIVTSSRVWVWSATSRTNRIAYELPRNLASDRRLVRAAYMPNGQALVVALLTLRDQMATDQGQAGLIVLDLAGPAAAPNGGVDVRAGESRESATRVSDPRAPEARAPEPRPAEPRSAEPRSFAVGGRQVLDLAVMEDGEYVVLASMDRTLRICQLSDGAEVMILRGHGDPIANLSIRGQWAVSADRGGLVKVWNLAERQEFTLWRQTAAVSFAPRANMAARVRLAYPGFVSAAEVRLLNSAEVVQEALRSRFANVDLVALSPRGDMLAMVGARGIHRTYRSLPPALRPPFLTAPRPQQFTLELWDAQRGQRRANLADGEQEFIDVRFSPDGKLVLAATRDHIVRAFSTSTYQLVFERRFREARDLWLSPDGVHALVLQAEGDERAWVLVDVASGEKRLRLKPSTPGLMPLGTRSAVAFSPDGARMAACEVETRLRGLRGDVERHLVTVWDTKSGDVLATLKGARPPLAIAPRGQRLVSGGGEGATSLQVWALPGGQPLVQVPLPEGRGETTLDALQFSGGGNVLAAVIHAVGQGIDCYVLDGNTLPDRMVHERRALQLVKQAAEECLVRSEIASEISGLSLEPGLRRVALHFAEQLAEPTAQDLLRAAWKQVAFLPEHMTSGSDRSSDVSLPSPDPEMRRRALVWAAAAREQLPGDPLALLVHAAALGRNGRWEETRELLLPTLNDTLSAQLALPTFAFVALAEHHLGNEVAARTYAARMFQFLAETRAVQRDAVTSALIREVQRLVLPRGAIEFRTTGERSTFMGPFATPPTIVPRPQPPRPPSPPATVPRTSPPGDPE